MFVLSGLGGHVYPLRPFCRRLKNGRASVGILHPEFVDPELALETVEDICRYIADRLLARYQGDTFTFLGYSMGGLLAYELASILAQHGKQSGVILVDTSVRSLRQQRGPMQYYPLRAMVLADTMWSNSKSKVDRYRAALAKGVWRPVQENQEFGQMRVRSRNAFKNYQPPPTDFPLYLIKAKTPPRYYGYFHDEPDYGWSKVGRVVGVRETDGDHMDLFKKPHVETFTQVVDDALDIIERDFAGAALDAGPVSSRPTPMPHV